MAPTPFEPSVPASPGDASTGPAPAGSPVRRRSGDHLPVGVVLGVLARLTRRPVLLPTALRQVRAMRRPGWWRRPPFLPLPPAAYARFRLQTMYGGDGALPDGSRRRAADDIVGWLAWVRQEDASRRRGHA